MQHLSPALDRLREFRKSFGEDHQIDERSGLTAGDLDEVLADLDGRYAREDAQSRAEQLHLEEEAELSIAAKLPEGDEKDTHRMQAERLSDEAWHIEENSDAEPRPSGLWPENGS